MINAVKDYADLTTAPERMQRVHTFILFVLPPEVAILTILRFGSQRLLVLLCAWETLFPVIGPLPQISHTLAIFLSLYHALQTEDMKFSNNSTNKFAIFLITPFKGISQEI